MNFELTEQSIPVLEADLAKQVASGSNNGSGNRALLQLYQLYPSHAKLGNVVSVLVKAVMALPDPDFVLSLCLLPAALQAEPAVAALVEAEAALQRADFAGFFAKCKAEPLAGVLAKFTGFADAVRNYVFEVVARTYASLPAATLAAMVDVSPAALPALVSTRADWSMETGADGVVSVRPPVSAFNSSKGSKREEGGISYAQVSNLVKLLGL